MPRRFLPARAFRARTLIATGLLLAPLGARVVWLEHAWGAEDACFVERAFVVGDPGEHRIRLHVRLESPYCGLAIDGSPPLPTADEARRRADAFPVDRTIPCHRPPGLCGAAVTRAHVAALFWLFPVASLTLLAAGALHLRRPPPPAPPPAGAGPFRTAPPSEIPPPREPLVIPLPGPGAIARIGALVFLIPLGALGAPAMAWIFWSDPLDSVASPLIGLVLLAITAAMLGAGLYTLFGHRRLVVEGNGRAAHRSAGFGPLDFMRRYASFTEWPRATTAPVEATARFGRRFTVGFALVLSDGRSVLRAEGFEDRGAAAEAAARVEARRPDGSAPLPF